MLCLVGFRKIFFSDVKCYLAKAFGFYIIMQHCCLKFFQIEFFCLCVFPLGFCVAYTFLYQLTCCVVSCMLANFSSPRHVCLRLQTPFLSSQNCGSLCALHLIKLFFFPIVVLQRLSEPKRRQSKFTCHVFTCLFPESTAAWPCSPTSEGKWAVRAHWAHFAFVILLEWTIPICKYVSSKHTKRKTSLIETWSLRNWIT